MAKRTLRTIVSSPQREDKYWCARCEKQFTFSQLRNYDCPQCNGGRLSFVTLGK